MRANKSSEPGEKEQAGQGSIVPNPSPDPIPVKVDFRWAHDGYELAEVSPAWDQDESSLFIQLHLDEAEGYYLNASTEQPSIFVHWRADPKPHALLVTLSYNEAARLLDGGEQVDGLPMPPEMHAWLVEYVNLHYEPETKKKSKTKPSFLRREEFGEFSEREKRGAK